MNRIDRLFANRRAGVLNVYFTAGYPALDDTLPVIRALDDAGVDMIEVGIPYSDPMADGPTIQHSGSVALQNGMTLDRLFDQLGEVRTWCDRPLLLMGYLNQMMRYGVERFLDRCEASGIDGLIIPDLPIDVFEKEYSTLMTARCLHLVFLITPQTSAARIRKIDELSGGFVYMVADSSITGSSTAISTSQVVYFERIAAMELRNPRLIGFGISDHSAFRTACQYAHGAIVGSAFIRCLGQSEGPLSETVRVFVENIRGVEV